MPTAASVVVTAWHTAGCATCHTAAEGDLHLQRALHEMRPSSRDHWQAWPVGCDPRLRCCVRYAGRVSQTLGVGGHANDSRRQSNYPGIKENAGIVVPRATRARLSCIKDSK
uniref:Putative secreted protein n=1 Tax=Ixodes ricinus TaxID=34613 RepID=A0A6B0UKB6_IXORI